MRTIPFTKAQKSLESVLDQVVSDLDYTVITRQGNDDTVLMSLEYFNGLMETIHLLKSPANAKHLSKSIKQFQEGKTSQRELVNE